MGEVFFQRSYDLALVDIWSLGSVFIEVVCRVGIIEETLTNASRQRGGSKCDFAAKLKDKSARKTRDREGAELMVTLFSDKKMVGALVNMHQRPEFANMSNDATEVLQ